MTTDDLDLLLSRLRPALHRYCARMVGSSIDGEDVVQEVLVKALTASSQETIVANPQAWLFRIAHNAALDFLRQRARQALPLTDDVIDRASTTYVEAPDPFVTTASFRTFMRLPALQRCAVILKDVLGHSVEDIAAIVGCSVPAAKSALQRGRLRLRELSGEPPDLQLPLLSDADRQKLAEYVHLF